MARLARPHLPRFESQESGNRPRGGVPRTAQGMVHLRQGLLKGRASALHRAMPLEYAWARILREADVCAGEYVCLLDRLVQHDEQR